MEAESGVAAGSGDDAVGRPPSVPENLWNVIPAASRKEFVEAAAAGLRRGVHPKEMIGRMLKERQIDQPPPKPPSVRRAPPRAQPPKRPAVPLAKPAAAVQEAVSPQPVNQAQEEPAVRAVSLPLQPYGMPSQKAGSVPRGVIGVALHKEMGLSGPPGKSAAEAEASVLAAIASDPVMAFSDPAGLRSQGARISRQVAEAVSSLVRQEADRVIEDIRRRKQEGDPVAARWIDPDDWSFQHGDADDADNLPRP